MKRKVSGAFKRFFDIILSLIALGVLSPVLLIAAIGIRLQSPGPVIYRAARMGKNMIPFSVYKFRTMHVGADKQGSITAANDPRVFKFGSGLRKLKIDELPQLVNILKGHMSIIGPRPEDIGIVNDHYTDWMKETLSMSPGLASPGSVFNYTHGDDYLQGDDTEQAYLEKLMPIKLAMDYYYVKNFTLGYDIRIVGRTIKVIVSQLFGKKDFKMPEEYVFASEFIKSDAEGKGI